MWVEGEAYGYHYYAKVYDEPSKYGIENGRISKLEITDPNGIICCHYDRGWDIEPTDDEIEKVMQHILSLHQ